MARGAQLITIYWRDIPAQVNAKIRGQKHQVLLKPRFQKAIDRAAMVADITTSTAYVSEWRQDSKPLRGDLTEAAEAAAQSYDERFPLTRLDELVANGGFEPETAVQDSTQPDSTQPDSTQPDSTQPDSTQPDSTQPRTTQPEAAPATNLESSGTNADEPNTAIGEPSHD